ncbi:hypothetical protein LX36DRAFT_244857 [Colletotrichum falcatum]|nr:hypothetical protein LX36DRAFT_244857 [Colletotrichum falcatum]
MRCGYRGNAMAHGAHRVRDGTVHTRLHKPDVASTELLDGARDENGPRWIDCIEGNCQKPLGSGESMGWLAGVAVKAYAVLGSAARTEVVRVKQVPRVCSALVGYLAGILVQYGDLVLLVGR